jgi:hypothetical protein
MREELAENGDHRDLMVARKFKGEERTHDCLNQPRKDGLPPPAACEEQDIKDAALASPSRVNLHVTRPRQMP